MRCERQTVLLSLYRGSGLSCSLIHTLSSPHLVDFETRPHGLESWAHNYRFGSLWVAHPCCRALSLCQSWTLPPEPPVVISPLTSQLPCLMNTLGLLKVTVGNSCRIMLALCRFHSNVDIINIATAQRKGSREQWSGQPAMR